VTGTPLSKVAVAVNPSVDTTTEVDETPESLAEML
jgi:hypothetical protein